MGGVGHHDLAALFSLPLVVGADHHDAGELALGARGGLERHAIHSADLGELPLEAVEVLQQPLGNGDGLEGMGRAEAGETGDPLVELRVVLHGAGAEGIGSQIHGGVPGGESREVPYHLDLGELGQARDLVADGVGGQLRPGVDLGNVERRQRVAHSTRGAALEEERLFVGEPGVGGGRAAGTGLRAIGFAHASPPPRIPASRSMDSLELSSVVQTRSAGPSSGA